MQPLQQNMQTREANCVGGERLCKSAIPLSSNAYSNIAPRLPLALILLCGVSHPSDPVLLRRASHRRPSSSASSHTGPPSAGGVQAAHRSTEGTDNGRRGRRPWAGAGRGRSGGRGRRRGDALLLESRKKARWWCCRRICGSRCEPWKSCGQSLRRTGGAAGGGGGRGWRRSSSAAW
jgi:hypothetical protein